MNNKLNWDDLKIVSAIGAAGSLSGGARLLATSHATVYRRLGRIEKEIGARLFDRNREGYRPTPAGEKVLLLAERIQADVLTVERGVAGQDLMPSGTVRVTTTDSLFVGLVAPALASFRRKFSEITVEVTISNRTYDLSRREADVAIRPGNAPPETLVGRKVGRIRQAAYVCAGGTVMDFRQTDWIGVDGAMPYRELETWIGENGLDSRVVQTCDSVLAMQASALAGIGAAILPLYMAEENSALRRLGPPIADLTSDLWVLVHQDLRSTARVKALTEHVGAWLSARLGKYADDR